MKATAVNCPNAKPDSMFVRRLQEAKRKHKSKKKRDQKKFHRIMSEPDGNEERAKAGKVTLSSSCA
jgi:hypothetical protein